jgi:DNA-binding GntR family transcriptional regulator
MISSAPDSGGFTTKQAWVRARLRAAILAGELGPGARLRIDAIAVRYGVSAIPVREALRELAADGMVEIRAHAGAVVTGFDEGAAAEIFALLEALETAAARLAVAGADDDAIARLQGRLAELDRTPARRWDEQNTEFHLAFFEIAGMTRGAELFRRVAGDWERLRASRYRGPEPPPRRAAQREHRGMVEALASRDADALQRAVRTHNRTAAACYGALP